jgi:hypothetical protein
MSVNNEFATSAAAKTVDSPGLSYMGATSTVDALARFNLFTAGIIVIPTSAPITSIPSRPSRIESSSRVVHPPTSEVPVAERMHILACVLIWPMSEMKSAGRASRDFFRLVLHSKYPFWSDYILQMDFMEQIVHWSTYLEQRRDPKHRYPRKCKPWYQQHVL